MSSSPRSGFCGGGCHPSSPRKTPCMGDGWGMGAISYVSRLDLRECLPRRTDGCEGDGTRLSRRLPVHGSQVTLDWQGLASGTMRDGVVARLTSRLAGADTAVIICVGELDAVCAGLKFLSFVNLNPVSRPAPRPDARAPHTLTRSRNRRTRPEALPAAVRGPGKRRGSF